MRWICLKQTWNPLLHSLNRYHAHYRYSDDWWVWNQCTCTLAAYCFYSGKDFSFLVGLRLCDCARGIQHILGLNINQSSVKKLPLICCPNVTLMEDAHIFAFHSPVPMSRSLLLLGCISLRVYEAWPAIHFIVSIFSISMICIVLVTVFNCFRIQGSKLLSCQVCIRCLNVSSSSSSCQENWKWHFRKGIMLRYVYEMLNVYDGAWNLQNISYTNHHLLVTVYSGTLSIVFLAFLLSYPCALLAPSNLWINWQIFWNVGVNMLALEVTQSFCTLISHVQ
jgi:hypothetical protein